MHQTFLSTTIVILSAILIIGCERAAPTAKKPASRRPTTVKSTYSPFVLCIHTNVGTSGPTTFVHDVSEKTIDETIRQLDWDSSEQLVELEGPAGKLTASGYTEATEEWFQLHIVSRQRNSNASEFSRNLSGVDEVVDVFQSYVRQDGQWKTSLTWSNELRAIPKRLLPPKMQDDPSRIPAGLRIDESGE